MICKNCNISIPERAVFCPACGTEAVRTVVQETGTKKCLQCGAENPLHAKFCRVDGWGFPADVMESKPVVDSPIEGGQPFHEPGKNAKGFRNKRLWIYLAVLFIFSFAVAFWFFSGLVTKSQRTAGGTEQTTRTDNEPGKKKKEPQADRKPNASSKGQDRSIDLPRLEGQINRELRGQGLDGIKAEVDDHAEVTLKGVVNDPGDKKKALAIVKSFKGTRQVKDLIFVIER